MHSLNPTSIYLSSTRRIVKIELQNIFTLYSWWIIIKLAQQRDISAEIHLTLFLWYIRI